MRHVLDTEGGRALLAELKKNVFRTCVPFVARGLRRGGARTRLAVSWRTHCLQFILNPVFQVMLWCFLPHKHLPSISYSTILSFLWSIPRRKRHLQQPLCPSVVEGRPCADGRSGLGAQAKDYSATGTGAIFSNTAT